MSRLWNKQETDGTNLWKGVEKQEELTCYNEEVEAANWWHNILPHRQLVQICSGEICFLLSGNRNWSFASLSERGVQPSVKWSASEIKRTSESLLDMLRGLNSMQSRGRSLGSWPNWRNINFSEWEERQ